MPDLFHAARTPRILWVELTSKCPFDCIFCSRKTLRGAGAHMPYALYESLVRQVANPRIFRLNYSGESTVYPDLIPAIRLARSSGPFVELVTALGSAPDALLADLAASGLNRLTVSIHTTDPQRYDAIYRYSSWETLHARLVRFAELCSELPRPPILDFAFVAMDRNLADLPGVAALADSLGVRHISIFPVIRRDDIPVAFGEELTAAGDHRGNFVDLVRAAAARVSEAHPQVTVAIANPLFNASEACIGAVPRPYPWTLPAGARIHSCEQNPWETAHVLSNGDVVACEVLDREPLGNLAQQSLEEIWNGPTYASFRRRYHSGEVAACRTCPWKSVYHPGPLESDILASRGASPQLVHGWHDPDPGDGHIWSSQEAAAVLAPRAAAGIVHVSGILPPGPEGQPNELTAFANGRPIGAVSNAGPENLRFGLDFPAHGDASEPWPIEFRTSHVYRPSETGASADQRDLGFALVLLAAKRQADPAAAKTRRAALDRLQRIVETADALCRHVPRRIARRSQLPFGPGLSILIPERGNAAGLAACLRGVREAARRWLEVCAEPRRTASRPAHLPLRPGLSILIPERDNADELAACLRGVREAARRWLEVCAEPRRTASRPAHLPLRPGVSILIPERDNAEELAACLRGVREAARRWLEPCAEPRRTASRPSHLPLRPGLSILIPERDNPAGLAACLRGVREAARRWLEVCAEPRRTLSRPSHLPLRPGVSILIPERDNAEERAACLRGVRDAARRWLEVCAEPRRTLSRPSHLPLRPGLSILIPERDNAEELAACLRGVRDAAHQWIGQCAEPLEIVVVVNGSPAADYASLQTEFPAVRWQFHNRALGFSGAIAAGLRAVRFDWVYLLNNDCVLEPGALATLAPLRDERNFAIASQIFLRDPTRFRDETNWTALLFEDGLATIHDCIPQSTAPVERFYAGGGASLFQTGLLRRVLDASAYQPFYWEDVEWGWRARKLGYRCLFCPASAAHHARRATIARNYPAAEIETVIQRHRLLFQLRNLTGDGFLDRALDEIAEMPDWEFFLRPSTVWKILRGRWWNHRAQLEKLAVQ